MYDSSRVLTPEILGRALGEAPDPELARIAVSRVEGRPGARELLERPDILPGAARLLGFSTAASDFFSAHPEELEALSDLRRRTPEELVVEAESMARALGASAGVRRFRRRASNRVAARDLGGDSADDVMAELSLVAEACLILAVQATSGTGDLAVIGMGKLGGKELNYSSDVDVVFVHGGTGGEAQESAGRAAAAVISLLAEPTSEGVALRVDATLRPEGRNGPLVRTSG